MKKMIFYSLLFVGLLKTTAQNNAYYERMEHIFGAIDKTKVTTGYLKEFGIRFNEIEAYNGTISNTNFVDKTQWQSLYSSLYTMRIGNTATTMLAPNTVFTNLTTQQNITTEDVLLAVQYYYYQQYKSTAVSNGDVTISNDRIYDVPGRNPYDTKSIFAVTPLQKELQGNTFTFKIPSALQYTNTGVSLSQAQIDFGNGQGYQILTLNTAKNITYTSGGEKELKYKFTYANGNTVYSHSKIWIDYSAPQNYQARYSGSGLLYNKEPITGDAWQGASATGFVTVELADGHTKITKPLIVVEGFDPDGGFDYYDLVNKFDGSPGSLNIDLDSTNLYYSFNEAIEDQGYDLVFIDYANGTDYIQRNALMVENVIKWVNGLKEGNEKNVVLGMSMGGLVARYALRNMELKGETHETKLYISHDTPHQGANVPLGFQAFVRHLYGEEISIPILLSSIDVDLVDITDFAPDLKQGFELLQSPAAQQMLIYQTKGIGDNVSINTNTLADAFYNEYATMGNPTQNGIRNIAIANGSECGVPLSFSDNATLVNIDEKVDLPWFITNILLAAVNALSLNPLKVVSSILSTDTDVKARFNVKALPNQTSKQIYKGEIFISKTILWVITVHEPLIDDLSLNSSSSMLPIDNANGGIYDMEQFINLPSEFDSYVLQREFNFIPTYSSLNIGGGNENIVYDDLHKVYSPVSKPSAPKDVPFDNFFTNPLSSENHIQFTLNNGNWLLNELKNNTGEFPCAFACGNYPTLTDESYFCTTETYSINSLAENVTWAVVDNNNLVTYSTSGNNITLNQTNQNQRGSITLNVTHGNDSCGFYTLSKEIWVGMPNITATQINGDTFICSNEIKTFSVDIPICMIDVNWSVSPNLQIISENNNTITVSQNTTNLENAGFIKISIPGIDFELTKGVWVGIPNKNNINIQKIGSYDFYSGQWSQLMVNFPTLIYEANNEPMNLTYEWSIPNSQVRSYNDTAYKDVNPNNSGTLNIGVKAENECGCSDFYYKLFNVTSTGGNGDNELIEFEGGR